MVSDESVVTRRMQALAAWSDAVKNLATVPGWIMGGDVNIPAVESARAFLRQMEIYLGAQPEPRASRVAAALVRLVNDPDVARVLKEKRHLEAEAEDALARFNNE